MAKSITLELPDWANWIAQDYNFSINVFESEIVKSTPMLFHRSNNGRVHTIMHRRKYAIANNWRDSKINLNTHGAYIDADGILHRCELVPDMLKEQA